MASTLRLVDYDPDWPLRFEAEAARIRSGIGDQFIAVEHVGSSAVPGLAGKPLLDIAIAVASESVAEVCIAPMEELGYVHRGPHGDDPRRRYFVRDIDGVRATHVHMYIMPAKAWDDMLAFRNALRENPELRAAYVAEKWRVADAVGWDRAAYSVAKGEFVQATLARLR